VFGCFVVALVGLFVGVCVALFVFVFLLDVLLSFNIQTVFIIDMKISVL